MSTSIEDRVRKIVMEQLGVREEEARGEASFVDDLGAAWLDTVRLVMALEDEFGLEIPDETAQTITTVQQAIDYIHGQRNTNQRQGEPITSSTGEQIACLVADQLGIAPGSVTARAAFAAGLGIDARQAALPRPQVEQQLNTELPRNEAKDLTTIGGLVGYVDGQAG